MTHHARPLLHICHAPADRAWILGRMVVELGLPPGRYHTREDDELGELQITAISRAVEHCRFTVLVASSAARWNRLAQLAASLAQHAGLEQDSPRLVIVARDFQPDTDAAQLRLPLHQRALVSLDCSDDLRTAEALARLRAELALADPVDYHPPCPYPGLARFTAANRALLFGRDSDRERLVDRVRAGHRRILVVGPSGCGKSSLVHAAVLPELTAQDHVVQVVPRGDHLADALRQTVDTLDLPGLGPALDTYQRSVRGAGDAQIEHARFPLRALPIPDARRRVLVVDPLEEIFAEDDAEARIRLFALLSGLWSLPGCTVMLCMRADFYGELMVERCWRELEDAVYPVAPLDEPGLRAAIVEPALRAGVHVDAALVERLMREIDRDRSSIPLPLLQVALAQLWTRLRWRHLGLTDYEQFVDRDQRGLAVVLGTHATAVLQKLTLPGDRIVAQRVLLDLVHLGEGRPDTRRRRSLDDLCRAGDAPGQLERVVDQLIDGRLVTAADSAHADAPRAGQDDTAGQRSRYIDLAHDALISGWPMLARWIHERRDDLRTQRRLEARTATRALLTGDELPEFVRWLAHTGAPAGQLLEASQSLHDLVRRSVLARRLRRIAIAAGLLVSLLIALVFGIQAQRLRDEKAKTQQSIAESLRVADLVVFEADDLLRSAGTSPARKRLLDSAQALLRELQRMAPSSKASQRTRAAAKMAAADLALTAGKLPEASTLYQEMLMDAKARAAQDPSSTTSQRELSVLFEKLGNAAVTAGELEDAHAFFDQSLAIRKALAADDPARTTWQREFSVSLEKLADVAARIARVVGEQRAMRAGKVDDANPFLDHALAVRKAFAARSFADTIRQRDLAVSFNMLGDIAVKAGKLDDARAFFDRALAVAKALVEKDPANTDWQCDLAVSYTKLGDVVMRSGKFDEARAFLDQALAVRKALAAKRPHRSDWQRDLSVSFERLGDIAARTSKFDEARAFLDQALAVRKALAAKDPARTDWQRDLSVSFERLGDIAVTTGKLDDARAFFDQALAVRKALAAKDPARTDWQRDLAISLNKLGELAVREALVAKDPPMQNGSATPPSRPNGSATFP